MPFVKGKPKTGGRVAGVKNTKTQQWEAIGDYLVNEGSERFKEFLLTAQDEKFASYFMAILEYFKPKQSRTEVKQSGEQTITIKYDTDPRE